MPRELDADAYNICGQWTPYSDPYSQSLAYVRGLDNRYRPSGLRTPVRTGPLAKVFAAGLIGLAGLAATIIMLGAAFQ